MNIIVIYYNIIGLIQSNIIMTWITLIIGFTILAKCADIFVNSSVEVAEKFKIPKLIIGIVLVSFATTTPELAVSLMSAISGQPQMALGNAIGSVICDDGLALAFAGIVALSPIIIMPQVLKTSGLFLIIIEIVAFIFVVFDNTLNRWEGAILILICVCYMTFLVYQHKQGTLESDIEGELTQKKGSSLSIIALFFVLSLCGIIVSSKFIIISATKIAYSFGIPEAIIALTIVAFGTSIPEVATCIVAARKKQGAIAVGNIIGADILNICWVAGASAMANPLVLAQKEILFMFPAMFIIVGAMLVLIRYKYSLTRNKGFILLGLYLLYLYLAVFVMKFTIHG
jgi:cation:H+ antiporter